MWEEGASVQSFGCGGLKRGGAALSSARQVVKIGKELIDRAAAGAEANVDSCAVEPLPFRFRDESAYEASGFSARIRLHSD